mmetsp:Transcript_3321/g.6824  ORF Transcript_3321/g.6824 Transcript_3321/m.6824 type:complete len:185 (-) Transcript_3321:232-786(-)
MLSSSEEIQTMVHFECNDKSEKEPTEVSLNAARTSFEAQTPRDSNKGHTHNALVFAHNQVFGASVIEEEDQALISGHHSLQNPIDPNTQHSSTEESISTPRPIYSGVSNLARFVVHRHSTASTLRRSSEEPPFRTMRLQSSVDSFGDFEWAPSPVSFVADSSREARKEYNKSVGALFVRAYSMP